MNIIQAIISGSNVYLFTDNPEHDVKELASLYGDEEAKPPFPLGYEKPSLESFNFLGTQHPCIGLWFDNEDVPNGFNNYILN